MKYIFIVINLIIMAFGCAAANAASLNTVKDMYGSNIMVASGDCLRTHWMVGSDACNPEMNASMIATGKVLFSFDGYQLKPDEVVKLDKIVSIIKTKKVNVIEIYGFTDPIGTDKYNMLLSQKRALAVYDYLKARVNLDNIDVDIKGFGKHHQVKACSGTKGAELLECLAPNRRVVVTSEIQGQ